MAIKYSLVVPIYNDAYLAQTFVDAFYSEMSLFLDIKLIEVQVELIFVNDGSLDGSFATLKELSHRYPFVKVIELSRNFGHHIALTAGYEHAAGEYVGMMNVDLQEHPLEYVKMLRCFIDSPNVDFVLGLRTYRGDGFVNRVTSRLFYIFLNRLTGDKTPINASTVRVMNRKFLNAYLRLNEKSRYIPGLENWLGFNHLYIDVNHSQRKVGKSSYNFSKRLKMAFEVVLSFSDLPLRIAALAGFVISIIGFLMTFFLILQSVFFINFQAGYTSTISLIVFLSGVQIMFIGLSSLYVGRILREVQNRPLYLIKKKLNF